MPTPMPPIERIPLPLPAPEDVVVAEGGQVYTALRDDGVLVEGVVPAI